MSDGSDIVRRAQARVGSVLRGKYHLDRVLGIGGMATVYAATHRNQARFAVKLLHAEISLHEDVRTRFLREGYVANSVQHAGAVLVVDDDVAEDGAAFLVMELLEGATVDELADRYGGKLPVAAAVAIVDQLLEVLSAAHDKSIVHRDIKPANLFITRDGGLKVLDFGIARARDAAATTGHATGTGMLLGTPAFMAPEQALGKSRDIDAQTDVWAVGATLFTLLTGGVVHEGENAPQLLVAAATTRARSLASVAPETPMSVAEVVDRALAFDKNERWLSAAAMREGLRAAWSAAAGETPSRTSLLPLLVAAPTESDGPAEALAPTRPKTPVPTPNLPAPHRPFVPIVQIAAKPEPVASSSGFAPHGIASALRPGVTTTQPLPDLASRADPPAVPLNRSPLVIAVVIAVVTAIGVGWGLMRPRPGAQAPVAAAMPEAHVVTPAAVPAAPSTVVPAPAPPLPMAGPTPAPAPPSPSITTNLNEAAGTRSPGKKHRAPSAAQSASGSTAIPIKW